MKKFAIILVILMIITVFSASAVGIGASFGLPIGGLPGTDVMLSAKLDSLPFLLGLGFGIEPAYFGATADWWVLNENLAGALNIYLGPGLYIGGAANEFQLGGRLPIGLNMYPVDFLELFVEIAPTLTIAPVFPSFGAQAAFGLRFWF
ncbi:hypothetical protein [Salinispira pacifica]|uniref:Uncharacterized protein n=1 Tax=Salinispira pacifica TaxID=1307761 RepID=V5WHA9_9SPIO|nr:hypothetical protein [Salinispira pacifica]AHC14536.1 hypothetical protein L21SP2_1133 [Salinispira pacifica]